MKKINKQVSEYIDKESENSKKRQKVDRKNYTMDKLLKKPTNKKNFKNT